MLDWQAGCEKKKLQEGLKEVVCEGKCSVCVRVVCEQDSKLNTYI